jgi:hypothetical protein
VLIERHHTTCLRVKVSGNPDPAAIVFIVPVPELRWILAVYVCEPDDGVSAHIKSGFRRRHRSA